MDAAVDRAAIQAVAYGDVFDWPLRPSEVHRFLIGARATPAEVRAALRRLVPDRLSRRDGLLTLPGRDGLAELRRERAAEAARYWPIAHAWGRRLASLPFVRMVAVTGSLAADNVGPAADIDFLVVTVPGRVWVGRAFTSLTRRHAAGQGVRLCPNYILSEDALRLHDRTLFTAHELVRMIPISGHAIHRRMLRLNRWTLRFLPNARPTVGAPAANGANRPLPVRITERVLETPLGAWMDRLERERLVRKTRRRRFDLSEVLYSADCCKDHVDAQGRRIMDAFHARLNGAGAAGE